MTDDQAGKDVPRKAENPFLTPSPKLFLPYNSDSLVPGGQIISRPNTATVREIHIKELTIPISASSSDFYPFEQEYSYSPLDEKVHEPEEFKESASVLVNAHQVVKSVSALSAIFCVMIVVGGSFGANNLMHPLLVAILFIGSLGIFIMGFVWGVHEGGGRGRQDSD